MIKLSSIENEDIKNTLGMIDRLILANSDLITPEQLGQNYLLHIAKQKFQSLKPNISRRSLDGENNTIPRVHVSSTLLDCMRGYGGFIKEMSQPIDRKESSYRGGFHIYVLPFEYALKPNRKLVPEANATNEYWLFSYNKETAVFKPSHVELLVLKDLRIIGGTPSNFIEEITLFVRIDSDFPLKITQDKSLDRGCYQLRIRQYYGRSSTIELVNARSVDDKDFDEVKKNHTAMENHFPLATANW